METKSTWSVLKRYDQDHLAKIALPIGGIGTGTISLGGRGNLRDWEVYSHPDKGFIPELSFFALYAQEEGQEPVTRALEGIIEPYLYEGAQGSTIPNHGLPRFRLCSFETTYPFGRVCLSDPDVPVDVNLEAFNPLIPANPELSGIPVAILRFSVKNKTDQSVKISICGNMQNFIGNDSQTRLAKRNTNQFITGQGVCGIRLLPGEIDQKAEQYGDMAIAVLSGGEISYRQAWFNSRWNTGLLDYWDDFSQDGCLEDHPEALPDESHHVRGLDTPIASLATSFELNPSSSQSITFLIAWYFPNRQTWTPVKSAVSLNEPSCRSSECADVNYVGNFYATLYKNSWEVIDQVTREIRYLESETIKFVNAFCLSNLPTVVKEAALFNVSTLRTQTVFRTPDGYLFGWEGCNEKTGCCQGSCTHVWNYEQATAFLFGSLSKSMREVEFKHATGEDGLMSFRANLPIHRASEWRMAAADGQMGCLMKLYRDWQLSGDDDMLNNLWPKARKALEFCWIPGGWDADQDGVMEGCQHNTMDVEYYGPNPEIELWYLGALRAAEEIARYVGDQQFSLLCQDLFRRGSIWTDQNLFNGEYYEQHIRPPELDLPIVEGLRVGMGAMDLTEPAFQLGAGCLADQLVGQYMAHICGLGYLLDRAHLKETLSSIVKYNYRDNLYEHFNNMRSYALNGESALLVSTYPKGKRPKQPFPYATEAWTGLEYTAAAGMIFEGLESEGLKCITAARDRHDGFRRNPYNEAECGHHYARAMASWAAILALTGFHYSGVTQTMTLGSREGEFFWSNGHAWGSYRITVSGDTTKVDINLLYGSLSIKRLEVNGIGEHSFETPKTIHPGEVLSINLVNSNHEYFN